MHAERSEGSTANSFECPFFNERMRCISAAGQVAEQWDALSQARKRVLVRRFICRVDINARTVSLSMDLDGLRLRFQLINCQDRCFVQTAHSRKTLIARFH